MPLRKLLAINVAVLAWFALLFALPMGGQWVARAIWGVEGALFGGVAGFLLVLVGTIVGIIYGLAWSERQAQARVRREGARCTAFVKSYRRISMSQHRVLWVIHFAQGAAGREYVLEGLSDPWLADVCALGRPVAVIAHPDAETLVVEG